MTDLLIGTAALAAGLLLGGFFFGGLWWTVQRGASSAQPALWFMGSLLLRTTITLIGFYLVGSEDWPRWLLCLTGFVLARFLATRFLSRLPLDGALARTAQAHYAP